MPLNRRHPIFSTACLLLSALAMTPALGQVQAQNGAALDANQQVGSRGYNQASSQIDYRARNLLITGNVGGGRAFQGSINYSSAGSFRGSLGSDSLFNFQRDSVFSSPTAGGFGYNAGQIGDRAVVSRPTDRLSPGYRVTGGNSLSTRTTYNPGSGVVTFRQAGGGLVSISGFNSTESLRHTGSQIGLVRTPTGLASINASPLTGIRYNPLDVSSAPLQSAPKPDPDNTPKARLTDPTQRDANPQIADPTAWSQSLRVDGASKTALTQQDDLMDHAIRKSPLAITLGTQLQSQMALQLAGKSTQPNSATNAQATSLRERVFGKQATAVAAPNQPTKAPKNPYDKLIADILANAKAKASKLPSKKADPDADKPTADPLNTWQNIFDAPEQAIAQAKREARDAAMRISLGLVDQDGNIDYNAKLPTIDTDSELGKLLQDLDYDLPPVRTLAGQDPNRINKLMSRGEQELKAERYMVAESIYRQVLREKGDDPLAQAGLLHSQMGAGMIRSAALNLRGLFADHPELIALRYQDNLLPQTDRLRWLQNRLQKMIGERTHGAAPGLILAYLGYQLDAKPLIEFGLNVAESEAPRDPLMPIVREIWLNNKNEDNNNDAKALPQGPNK